MIYIKKAYKKVSNAIFTAHCLAADCNIKYVAGLQMYICFIKFFS